jgi:hypothetical protein
LKGGSRVAAGGSRAKVAKPAATAAPRAKAVPAAQPNILQTLIEEGAAILSGILRHPSVQDALGSTLRRRAGSRKR